MVPRDGGLGVGKLWGQDFLPDQCPSARHISAMLSGMCNAYETLGKAEYKNASTKLADWLVRTQAPEGYWLIFPRAFLPNYNGRVGNEIEAASESLRGLSELYHITGFNVYKTAADKAYAWIKGECEKTDTNWNSGRLPSEYHRAADMRYFNTLYMHTPLALIEYYRKTYAEIESLVIASEILDFMDQKMRIADVNPLTNNGIVGEWDLANDCRSQFLDDEFTCWGDWIFVGWTNTEFIDSVCELKLLKSYVNGWIVKCDFDNSSKIDAADFALFSSSYGSFAEGPSWNPKCDINGDGTIGPADFAIFSINYGKHTL
jgi:hypothetical protein